MLEDVGECRAFDGTMSRNGQFHNSFAARLLQSNMTPLLTDDDPPVPTKGVEDLVEVQTGDLAHREISISSASGLKLLSSSTGSR